jgi:hypothetical protein
VWCPYCQQIKASVFMRPDFIARSRQFVAVYLDGDDAGAQKWGERLQVQGYPSLLVLDATGRETQRISGGMKLERYADVLDLALAICSQSRRCSRCCAGQPLPRLPARCLECWELELVGGSRPARWTWIGRRITAQHAAPAAARLAACSRRCCNPPPKPGRWRGRRRGATQGARR